MKKIYLKPEIELTECVMLRTAVCSGGIGGDHMGGGGGSMFGGGAPPRKGDMIP